MDLKTNTMQSITCVFFGFSFAVNLYNYSSGGKKKKKKKIMVRLVFRIGYCPSLLLVTLVCRLWFRTPKSYYQTTFAEIFV